MGAIKNFFHDEIQINEVSEDEYFFQKWQEKAKEEIIMNWMDKQEENLAWDIQFQQIYINPFKSR
jgi:hypothetical protein